MLLTASKTVQNATIWIRFFPHSQNDYRKEHSKHSNHNTIKGNDGNTKKEVEIKPKKPGIIRH